MKAPILILLAALLTGCNDRFSEYRAVQKAYPNAKVEPIPNIEDGQFLVVETNGTVRVVSFPTLTLDNIRTDVAIPSDDTVER